MSERKNILIEFCRRTFALWGQDPYNKKKYANFFLLLGNSFCLLTIILSFLEPVYNYDIGTVAHSFEPICPYVQTIWKSWIYIKNQDRIQNLLNKIDIQFWPENKFKHLETNHKYIQNMTLKIMKILQMCVTTAVAIIITMSFISENRRLLFDQYHPADINNNAYYIPMVILNIFTIIMAAIMVLGFDMLYISFLTLVSIQLDMLNYGFTILGKEEVKTEQEEKIMVNTLSGYVVHHAMLLEFVEEIKDMLSTFFLGQYSGTTMALCMITYFINANGLEDPRILEYITNVLAYLVQLFLYCAYAEYITSSLSTLSNAAYFSGWTDKKCLASSIQIVIMRSQKEFKLTAAGVFDVDMVSYSMIIKSSFSFLTFLRTVSEKEES